MLLDAASLLVEATAAIRLLIWLIPLVFAVRARHWLLAVGLLATIAANGVTLAVDARELAGLLRVIGAACLASALVTFLRRPPLPAAA